MGKTEAQNPGRQDKNVPPAPAQRAEAARIARELAQGGFALPGTLTERLTRCGRASSHTASSQLKVKTSPQVSGVFEHVSADLFQGFLGQVEGQRFQPCAYLLVIGHMWCQLAGSDVQPRAIGGARSSQMAAGIADSSLSLSAKRARRAAGRLCAAPMSERDEGLCRW